uniref:Uncharacterized protein n=1 Tax=Avena sativa TaxID=4498 RepID=A0ACD6AIG1_AVESA
MPRPAKRRPRAQQGSSWPDLPPELLADVLGRLQLEDRGRFRGVCTTWRAAERDNPCTLPMPWLVAPGRCVSLHDAAIHRAPLMDQDARGAACRGSFGNWLALVPMSDHRGRCQPFLLNAFTMARIQLPRWTGEPISKISLSSTPNSDSECCTVAAIIPTQHDIAMKWHSLIAVCRSPGQPTCRWSISTNPHKIRDIAFFNGKLYAVDGSEHVFVYEEGKLKELQDKLWTSLSSGSDAPSLVGMCRLYLVPCHGRLIMVSRSFGPKHGRGYRSCNSAAYAFDDSGDSYDWVTVSGFEGHAIFVGDACCRAFAVEASSGSKIRENQICFVDDELAAVFTAAGEQSVRRSPFRSVQSYDVRSKCIRTYLPCELPPTRVPAGAWHCDAVQRLHPQRHRHETMPVPPRTYSEAQLQLWEVMACLGAGQPYYATRVDPPPTDAAAGSATTVTAVVTVDIPKIGATIGSHRWRFEGRRPSGHRAAEVAAKKAVTFLRSAFRNTLDDSPWSSIPYYHTHVEDKDAEEQDPPQGQGHQELNLELL